jgi:hypothetical protein
MTITYSGDPSASGLDEVRYLLQDTDVVAALFSNEEIAFLLSHNPTPIYAAAAGAEVLAARFAGSPNSRTLGDVTVSYADMCDRYTKLAATLRRSAASSSSSIPVPFFAPADRVMPSSDEWSNAGGSTLDNLTPTWP